MGLTVDVVRPADMVASKLENGVTENGEAYVVCPGCGAELPADSASCFICGASLVDEGAETSGVESSVSEEDAGTSSVSWGKSKISIWIGLLLVVILAGYLVSRKQR